MLTTTFIQAQTYSGGSGTVADPYLISSKTDMETLATAVNGNSNYSTGKYFLLTQDITNAITTIIGISSTYPFKGTFDGGNHSLSININVSSGQVAGIFGSITDATIKNLNVKGTLTSSYYATITGTICGQASGTANTITNCNSSVLISTSTTVAVGGICGNANYVNINNCSNTGSIIASGSNVGGICGSATNVTISQCSNTGSVTASGDYTYQAAGICANYGSVSSIANCYNTGNIIITNTATASTTGEVYAGGICASTIGTSSAKNISNCYNTGSISATRTGSGSYNCYAAGICAYGYSGNAITNCFNTGNVSAINGGSAGSYASRISNYGTPANCYALSSVVLNGVTTNSTNNKNGTDVNNISFFQDQNWIITNLNWDFTNIWKMSDINSVYNGLPIFIWQDDNSVVTATDTNNINNIEVYPNPANQNMYINSNIPINEIEIFDITGKLVKKTNIVNNINVSLFTNGIYYFCIHTNNSTVVKKVVVSH